MTENESDPVGITFKAHFARLSTLADGGVRVSFDISLSELTEAVKLPKLGQRVLQVAIIPEPVESEARGPW